MTCTTHHHACQCREAYYRQLHDQVNDLTKMLKGVVILLNDQVEHEKIKAILRESLQCHPQLNASDYYL